MKLDRTEKLKRFTVWTEEGHFLLTKEDVLNHVDTYLEELEEEESMDIIIKRIDITPEELDNLPVIER